MNNANGNLTSWDKFSGNAFIKSSDIANENDPVVVIGCNEITNKEGKQKIQWTLEKAGKQFKKDLISADIKACKQFNISSPLDTIGKKVYFRKVLVTSPKTKTEVESLRISKIE